MKEKLQVLFLFPKRNMKISCFYYTIFGGYIKAKIYISVHFTYVLSEIQEWLLWWIWWMGYAMQDHKNLIEMTKKYDHLQF